MVKQIIKNNKRLWKCEACSFIYKKKEIAEKCQDYCNKYHQCSLNIIKYAIKKKKKKMIKYIKEKIIGIIGSVSGITSILGSWQVCHNVCLGIIVLLSIIGITVAGMPLLFLTKLAIPFWTIASILLLVTIGIYIKKKCISNRLIIFNSGLVIAGVPFQPLQAYSILFWIVGGILAITGISLFIKDKIQTRLVKL